MGSSVNVTNQYKLTRRLGILTALLDLQFVFTESHDHSEHPHLLLGRRLSLLPYFQMKVREEAGQDLNFLRGLLGKRGELFQVGCSFYIKSKVNI